MTSKNHDHGSSGNQMIVSLGSRQSFAMEVGEPLSGSPQLRRVDVWAASQWLTCDDNLVFVPQFIATVQQEINIIRGGSAHASRKFAMPFPGLSPVENHERLLADDTGLRQCCWFFNWGPTTDNVLGHLFRDEDRIVLTFEFWRAEHHRPQDLGRIFVAEIQQDDFIGVLQGAVRVLAS